MDHGTRHCLNGQMNTAIDHTTPDHRAMTHDGTRPTHTQNAIRGSRAGKRRMRRNVGESGDEGGGGGRGGGGGARSERGGGMGWLDIGKRRWQNGIGGRCRRGGVVRGVGVEGVGGGMAGGVLAAIAGRRPRRQRRRQRWPAPASGAGRHLEMGLGPANEQEGQNVRAWRLGVNMPGLGMRSGGC